MRLPGYLILILLLTLLAANGVRADECSETERVGARLHDLLLNEIRRYAEGAEVDLTKRKTLHIISVDALSFDGCKAIIDATVELDRKIRRDGKGVARIVAPTRLPDLFAAAATRRICFRNDPKLARLHLSNTTRVAESFYKMVANRIVPIDRCYPAEP
jgi:uncharacterized protein YjhX (UPF0386 family)